MSEAHTQQGSPIRLLAFFAVLLPTLTASADVAKKGEAADGAAVTSSVKRMMAALMGEDPKAITAQLWTENDLERQAAETWAASMTGQFRLRRLVFEKFGAEGMWDYDPRTRGNSPPGTKPQD